MAERINLAFEDNQLDILEAGRRKSEPNSHENTNSHREAKKRWATNSNAINAYLSKHQRVFKTFGLVILNLGVIIYIVFAGIYWKNEQKDCDFQWCKGFGFLLIFTGLIYFGLFYFLIVKRYFGKYILQCCKPAKNSLERLQNTKYGKLIGATFIYLIILIAIITFLIIDTTNSRKRLISVLGYIVLLGLGWMFSKHPGKINWRPVLWGLILQFIFGLIMLRWPLGRSIFECISGKVTTFLDYAKAGANFVFSEKIVKEGVFAFAVLPVIFFFSFIVQIMTYLGMMQWIILKLGWVLQSIMGTTLCESLAAVANPFIGMSESPLLFKPYVSQLTSSELHAIMGSGFSTVSANWKLHYAALKHNVCATRPPLVVLTFRSSTIFTAYIIYGAKPAHLVTSAIMSAPTSLAYSKLFYPETEKSLTKFDNIKLEKSQDTGLLDAATNGALAAIPIVLGVIANMVAFVSFVAFLNGVFSWFGGLVGYEELSLEIILAKVFMPLSWMMGVPWEQCEAVGTLIGLKTIVNELIAYERLGKMKKQGILFGKAEAIATFAICGFANPGSIAIQVGVFSSMAPEKKKQITDVVVRAFVTGSAACFLTASIAGMLIDELSIDSANSTTIVANITTTTITSLYTI